MPIDRGQGQLENDFGSITNPAFNRMFTTVQTASDESGHLALTTQEGDVVVRSDESKTYMHNGGSSGTISDFTQLSTTLQLDELTDGTGDIDGTQDELIYLDNGAEKRKLVSEINLSQFDATDITLNGGYF